MNKIILLIYILFCTINANSYDLEDKLKVVITGKIAKFITWHNHNSAKFVIGVYHDRFNGFFDDIYTNTSIKSKSVKIEYINNIEDLQNINILYISNASALELDKIFDYTKNKDIVTISDLRGFLHRGGMIQLYSKNQKIKIRINLDNTQKENIEIKSSLLRIVEVVREDKNENY
jgi:hypothetical protein